MRKLYSFLFSFIFISSSFAQIPTSGLVGEWKFDNGSLFESGYSSLGQAVAQSGAVPTTDRFGNTNYAYDLQAASYISFGDAFDLQTTGSNSFSFSYWVKFDQINNTYRYMLGKAGFPTLCGSDSRQFAFLIDGSNRVEAILFGALTGGHVRYASSGTVSANAWTHIVLAVNVQQLLSSNLTGMKIYINGVLQTTTVTETVGGGLSANGMDNGTADLSAARYAGPNGVQCGTTQYMDGQFDDLRVYNRLLSQQEVTQLYEHVPCAQTHITLQPESTVAFCAGGSADLTVEVDDPNATISWQVNTGNGWGYLGVQTGTVTVAGQYRVEVQSPCGAYAYSDVCTVVVDAPVFAPEPPYNAFICPGNSSVLLNGTALGEDVTYQWSSNSIQTPQVQSPILGATEATYNATEADLQYTVTATACGQSVTSQIVYVSNGVQPIINITNVTNGGTICLGGTANITIAVTFIQQVSWTPNDGTGASTIHTVSPSQTTTYTVIGTNNQSCTATASTVITVVDPEPVIVENGGVLEATGGAFSSYNWYLDGALIQGAFNSTYTPTVDGNYTLTANIGNCGGTSAPFVYTGVPTEIDGAAISGLKVYPNPFNTEFVIETTELTTISVMNAMGEVVLSRTINGRTSIDATSLSAGIYLVREETSGAVMKLVKN